MCRLQEGVLDVHDERVIRRVQERDGLGNAEGSSFDSRCLRGIKWFSWCLTVTQVQSCQWFTKILPRVCGENIFWPLALVGKLFKSVKLLPGHPIEGVLKD